MWPATCCEQAASAEPFKMERLRLGPAAQPPPTSSAFCRPANLRLSKEGALGGEPKRDANHRYPQHTNLQVLWRARPHALDRPGGPSRAPRRIFGWAQ